MGATLVSFAPNVISRITSIGISLTIVVSIIVSTIVVAMVVTRTSSGEYTLQTTQSFMKVALDRFITENELPEFYDKRQTLHSLIRNIDHTLHAAFSQSFVKIIVHDFTHRPKIIFENNQSNILDSGLPSLVILNATAYFVQNYTKNDIYNAMKDFSEWVVLRAKNDRPSGALAHISLSNSIFMGTIPCEYTVGEVKSFPQYDILEYSTLTPANSVPPPFPNRTTNSNIPSTTRITVTPNNPTGHSHSNSAISSTPNSLGATNDPDVSGTLLDNDTLTPSDDTTVPIEHPDADTTVLGNDTFTLSDDTTIPIEHHDANTSILGNDTLTPSDDTTIPIEHHDANTTILDNDTFTPSDDTTIPIEHPDANSTSSHNDTFTPSGDTTIPIEHHDANTSILSNDTFTPSDDTTIPIEHPDANSTSSHNDTFTPSGDTTIPIEHHDANTTILDNDTFTPSDDTTIPIEHPDANSTSSHNDTFTPSDNITDTVDNESTLLTTSSVNMANSTENIIDSTETLMMTTQMDVCQSLTHINAVITIQRSIANNEILSFYNSTATFEHLSTNLTALIILHFSDRFIKLAITDISDAPYQSSTEDANTVSVTITSQIYFGQHLKRNAIENVLNSYSPLLTLTTSTGSSKSDRSRVSSLNLNISYPIDLIQEQSYFYMCFPITSIFVNQTIQLNSTNFCQTQTVYKADVNIAIELFADSSLSIFVPSNTTALYEIFLRSINEYLISNYPQSFVRLLPRTFLFLVPTFGQLATTITTTTNIIGSIFFTEYYSSQEILDVFEDYTVTLNLRKSTANSTFVYGSFSSKDSNITDTTNSTLLIESTNLFTCLPIITKH